MKNLVVISLSIFMLIGCTNQPLMSSTATKYGLSEKELKELKAKALEGDSKSGNRIANYYEAVKNDIKEFEFWYRLSAEQGNKDSALSLAYTYSEVLKDPEKAIYWYESVGAYRPELVNFHLGRLYEAKGLLDKASLYYCQSYIYKDGNYSSKYLSNIYLIQGELIKALSWGLIYENELMPESVAWSENKERLLNMKKTMSHTDIAKAKALANGNTLCRSQ